MSMRDAALRLVTPPSWPWPLSAVTGVEMVGLWFASLRSTTSTAPFPRLCMLALDYWNPSWIHRLRYSTSAGFVWGRCSFSSALSY
jgi:hypothetical protein